MKTIQGEVICPFGWVRVTARRFLLWTLLLGVLAITASRVQAAAPMAGITSSSKFLIYYGDDFSSTNLNRMTNFNVVVIDANEGDCLPSSIAYLQSNGVKYVLGYISIGEEPPSVPLLAGNGNGPVYYTNGAVFYESNGYASYYVDQDWNGTNYVSDGLPDTNVNFGGRFVWPDSDWQWVLQNERIGGSSALPNRSLAGLEQLLGTRSSNIDTNRNDNFGFNGVFMDTLDTAGPYVDVWGYYAWAAPAMQQTVEFIYYTYTNSIVFANRGLFFYDPNLINTTFNIRPYDYSIRPYINGGLFESFTLDSDTDPTNTPYFMDNMYDYAPKIDAEANRPDGFTMFCLDYQMGRGNSWYQQAEYDSVVSNGWVEYEAPDGTLATVSLYMVTNPPPTDTSAPVWSSTGADSPTPAPPRVGIQSVMDGPDIGDVTIHWDVARDQTLPVGYNIYCSSNAAFTMAVITSNVVFSVGDGWNEDTTTHYANKYVLSGLNPGSVNYLCVRAHDSTRAQYQESNTNTLTYTVTANETANPVSLTNIVLNGLLNDWTKLRPLGTKSADVSGSSNEIDWISAWMAHDQTQFYLAFTNAGPVTINSAVNFYFDTDSDRGTGYRGGSDNFPIGAEYLLQGDSLYAYAGSGIDWNWTYVNSVSWAVSSNTAECSFPRIWLGNPLNTKLFLYGDNPSVGGSTLDVMPTNALEIGGGGPRLSYRIRDVSNPIMTNSIVLNGNLSDWVPYEPLGTNRLSATNATAFMEAWMAHDPTNFYVAFTNDGPVTINDSVNIYFDTDASRKTGFYGEGNNFPIGAEYLLQGSGLYQYSGNGTNWSWTNIATITWHVSGNNADCSFPRSLIGDPNIMNLIFLGDNGAGGQNYLPNYAPNVGGGGELFTYRKNDVSNSVTNGAIVVNGNLSDWTNLVPFGTDPQDATGPGDQLDWGTSWMANDSTNFYLAYQNYTTVSSMNVAWNTYFDTDANRLTGYRGSDSEYPIGADYLLQGTTLYQYSGTGTDWSWSTVGSVTYSWSGTNGEVSFPRSWIGNPSLVKVFYLGDNPSIGGTTVDYSPDTAIGINGGGVFYTYRVK